MPDDMEKPELLAPAGDFEKLETALHYGADAVYLAGKDFSLRNFSGNFSEEELHAAVDLTHKKGKRVYIACNIYPRNAELKSLERFIEKICDISPDAVIVSDPGVLFLVKKIGPHLDIHLSTQANTTNYNTVKFWQELGVKRVNLARELSLEEVKEISSISCAETEIFIHGAMCISYSGRCLLSTFLTLRDSNRGLCSHPCRWEYAVVEEKRPDNYHPLLEDRRGSYVFNSKDLCMIRHIPELINSKVNAFKIEGRMKGINYLASVLKTYREAIDLYCSAPRKYFVKKEWINALNNVYNRTYSTGFFFNDPDEIAPNYQNCHGGAMQNFIGKILRKVSKKEYVVQIRNTLSKGDVVEFITPSGPNPSGRIRALLDTDRNPVMKAHPNSLAIIELDIEQGGPLDVVRKIN